MTTNPTPWAERANRQMPGLTNRQVADALAPAIGAPLPKSMIGPRWIGGLTETEKMPGLSFSLPALITCLVGRVLASIKGTPCFSCYAKGGRFAMPMVVIAQARRLLALLLAIAVPSKGKAWVTDLAAFLSDRERRARKRYAHAPDVGKPRLDRMIAAYYRAAVAGARLNTGAKRIVKGGKVDGETEHSQALAAAYAEATGAWDAALAADPDAGRAAQAFIAWYKAQHFRWHDSGDVLNLAHLELVAQVAAATPDLAHWLPTQQRAEVKAYLAKHGSFPENLCVRISSPRLNVHLAPAIQGTTTSSVSDDGTTAPGAYMCPAYRSGGICADEDKACNACWHVPQTTYPIH